MKLVLVSIVLCVAVCVVSTTKLLASSTHQLSRRETSLLKRLVKRQARTDPSCNPRTCAIPNCGKDFVAGTLPGECCERCIPWEYARSMGIQYRQEPQTLQDNRGPQPTYDPRNQYAYNQPQQQASRADVYIYGPDEGARVSSGQSIYFDCEVIAPNNQYAQPRWSRGGNQPLPFKVQSTALPGNRKIARLTVPDATRSEAGRYECSAGTGNANEQASIDLQVTDGGYYPPPPPPQPQPGPAHEDDDSNDNEYQVEPTTPRPAPPPAPAQHEEGGEEVEDESEYPEDYSENEK